MDMVSTTGVEVMTEVVTEAAVGEVPVALSEMLIFPKKAFRKLKQKSNPQKAHGILVCYAVNSVICCFWHLKAEFWQFFVVESPNLSGWNPTWLGVGC